eukprot:scaffold5760_cov57-Phaeocystis_antarctica.AAC.3
MCRSPLAGRAAPASVGGEDRWSPSTRPATASTPPPPPRPPPPAVPGCEAPSQARAARARPSRAAAAPGYRSTAAQPGPQARFVGAGPAADSADWKAWGDACPEGEVNDHAWPA